MTTLAGLLQSSRAVTGSDAQWVPISDADLLAAGGARTVRDGDTTRVRDLGLPPGR